jgi:hypothetical protein
LIFFYSQSILKDNELILLHQIKRELFKKEGPIDVEYMTEFLLENTDIIDPYGELTLCIRCVHVYMCMYIEIYVHIYIYVYIYIYII